MTRGWLDGIDPQPRCELLLEVIDLAASTGDLAVMAGRAADLVVRTTGSTACRLHVMDEGGRQLVVAGAQPPAGDASPASVAIGAGAVGWVASHGRAMVTPAVPPCGPGVCVPIAGSRVRLCGVLEAEYAEDRPVSEREVELLTGLGGLLAPSISAACHHRDRHARERSRQRSAEEFIALQEADRRRLAAEVHDGVGQGIAGLSFHLTAAAESLFDRPEFAAEQLATARELAALAQQEVRSALHGLRPPLLDDLGLAEALAGLARRTPGLRVDVRVGVGTLPDHLASTLYRIAQEALQNVQKHSNAARAVVELFAVGGQVLLRITDYGDGFEPDSGQAGYGLRTMRERAEIAGGRLELVSRIGRGTTISVRIPVTETEIGTGASA